MPALHIIGLIFDYHFFSTFFDESLNWNSI